MAKGKNNDLLPVLGGIFCLFVVFLHSLSILTGNLWRISMLLMPSLWLVLGLCLLSRKKNWLMVVGMLPLTILLIQGAWHPVSMGNVQLFLSDLLCRVFPAVGYGVLFLLTFLSCLNVGGKLRRQIWLLPVLLLLPACIWQHTSTLPWAQLGMVTCVALWLKPAAK